MGPLVGGQLYQHWDYEKLPLVTSGCYLAAAMVIWRVLVLDRRLPEHHRGDKVGTSAGNPLAGQDGNAAANRDSTTRLAEEAGVEISSSNAPLALTADERAELEELRTRVAELERLVSGAESMLTPEQIETLGLHHRGSRDVLHTHLH